MSSTRFPALEEALHLHEQLIQRFGGSPGILDMGLLESALARTRSGYYTSLSEQAAALMQSLLLNHCFVDGNKRMAFALTAVFLLMNGYSLASSAKEAERFILDLIGSSNRSVSGIAQWLERHMEPI